MLKRLVQYLFLFLAVLPWLWWRCFARLTGKEHAFQGMSQLCALVPGKTGELLRAAFYRLSLPCSSQQTSIAFLSTFSSPKARLGRHVSTGAYCNIGWADIGDNCILASMVCIASGRQQHTFEDTGIPIRLQGGEKKQVTIGPDCWIGASAVILADIGEGSVIAAGSVVTHPIPPYSIAAGNPAKVVKTRSRPHNAAYPGVLESNRNELAHITQLTVALRVGGAERLALDLLRAGKRFFSGDLTGMYLEPSPLQSLAEAEGISSSAMRCDGKGRLVCSIKLWQRLRARKTALLHTHAEYLLPMAMPAAFLARVSLVFTVHSKHAVETMPKLRLFMRLASPWLRNVVCVSEPLREYYINTLGFRPGNVRVIQNGIDTDRFSPAGKRAVLPWNREAGIFVFGNVARLHEAKDLHTLVRSFAAVHKEHGHTRLLLVGDGELRADLESLISELDLNHAVHITGIREDIPELLRGLDMFTLSSRHEGMPMAILEAMACGLPVLSTRVGDIERLNRDLPCVALAPPENPEALAKEMTALMLDEERRMTLARNGAHQVRTHYSLLRMAEEYFALYRENGIALHGEGMPGGAATNGETGQGTTP